MRRVKSFRLSRRALLRGAGATLALPWLEAMYPGRAQAQSAPVDSVPRVLFIYFPSGYRGGTWLANKTAGSYTDFALPGIADALTPFKQKLTIITGMSNSPAAVGNGGDGIHARGTGCYLTNEVLQKGGFAKGVSADQIIAQTVGKDFCIPSLALGIPGERPPSWAEDGYGSVYYNNISFTGPTANVQRENNPKDLFTRLATCGIGTTDPTSPTTPVTDERRLFEQGVMSAVKEEASHLMSCVGQEDRLRLEQYYDSIAELERRFVDLPSSNTPMSAGCEAPTQPADSGMNFFESSKLVMDTLLVGFKCGLTPVATLMLDGAFSRRDYGLADIGGVDYVHGLSHGELSGKSVDHPRWQKITTHFFEQFAYLLGKMEEVKEGDRTLLDNSIVYIGSEFGDGDAHSSNGLPIIIAGSGRGKINVGRHIAVADRTPSANSILDVMHALGIESSSHGNSNGSVSGLLV